MIAEKNDRIQQIVPCLFGVVFLCLAIPSMFGYDYYIFLRWAISGLSVYSTWYFYKKDMAALMILFGISAIIFNPFAPFYFSKETWVVIDLAAIALFISSMFVKPTKADC